jgi:hypothetical protein
MPGYYGADGASRPRYGSRHRTAEEDTGRFFLCERCRSQVLICRCCDRGQIYCAAGCARIARTERRRDVARRYQTSRNGRFAHAARSRRYRARRNIVTHHGSPTCHADAYVMAATATAPMKAPDTADMSALVEPAILTGPLAGILGLHCHWCDRCCSPFVRRDPLRRRRAILTSPS